jgi:TPR repeat protein
MTIPTPIPHNLTAKRIRLLVSTLVIFFSVTAQADSVWVDKCSRANGLTYCQNVDKAKSVNTYSDAKIQEFGKVTNDAFDALTELFGSKKQSHSEWVAERQAEHAAQTEFNQKVREQLKTREGRRTYYGERKGKGDPEMDYRYAGTLDKESDVLKWMKSAADGGHTNAMYSMALYTERGLFGVQQDLLASQKLMEKAANAGQLTARSVLATRLMYGDPSFNIKQDASPAQAFQMVDAACNKKNMHACMTLGNFYRYGRGAPIDTAKAVALYNTVVLSDENAGTGANNVSFENEKAMAAFSLAEIYSTGEGGVAVDKTSARSYLLLAVNEPGLRITQAWMAYGNALLVPESDYALPQQDVKRGLEVFQWFANIDHAPAMDILGNLYLYGKYGVPKDIPMGLSWLNKAAKLGDVNSMLRLAGYYADIEPRGKEVQAFQWVKMAGDAGSAEGNWRLAMHYYRGMGVPTDDTKFKAALTKACELASASACYELGKRYLSDPDKLFEKNVEGARSALARADKKGKGEATFLLAKNYLSDDAMTPDTALLGVRLAASAVQRKVKGADDYWQMVNTANNPLVKAAVARVRAE